MNPTFIKKNTAGGAAGHSWEVGEVQALDPYLAAELVALAPEDFEIVSKAPPAPKPKIEVEVEVEPEVEDAPSKAKKVTKKSNTETPSAE